MRVLGALSVGMLMLTGVAVAQPQQTTPSFEKRVELQQAADAVRALETLHQRRCANVTQYQYRELALCADIKAQAPALQVQMWQLCKEGNFGRIVDPDGLVVCP